MLKIQYAARCCYNSTEVQNYFVWAFCLISAFSIFLPSALPRFISLAIPFIADIAAWVLMALANKNVHNASELRKYFDAYSLDIGANQFPESKRRQLLEIANKKYSKNTKKAEIQMKNTGKDDPPGVYDWYTFSKEYCGLEAKFECQRINAWWDKKLSFARCIVAVTVCGIAVLIIFEFMKKFGFIEMIFCSAGLLTYLLERVYYNIRYRDLSLKIDGAQQTVEAYPTAEGIEQLQILIDERRAVNVVGINFLHKKQAKKLTETYDAISNPQ